MRKDGGTSPPSAADLPTVAHLVTPYLFLTGSWIHSQLVYNRSFRPVVISQETENLELFPFEPVYDLGAERNGPGKMGFIASKYLRGAYPGRAYRRILDRERVRLVHAHLGWEGARAIGLSRNPRRPFLVSFYGRDAGVLSRKPYWRILYKRMFRQADRFLAEGRHMGQVLVSLGAPPEKVRVVHLGIPLESFPFFERRPPEDEREPIIGLIAASFREKKGISYAVDAMDRIAARWPRLRLRIIGDGPLRGEIEARIARHNLRDRVDLLGYRPYPVYQEELGRAHFLVAPSVTARDGDTEGGAPVCLLEAQAAGLPIVATRHCDIPEVTRPGKSAFLAPERDAAALADCLEKLLRNPGAWPDMGRAGRAHMEAEFNIHTQVERMNEVYRELLPD